tara:strand:- start:5518 stop:5832 length:315 start_codon:yes stop_codon:yes gene_type:complete
MATLDELKAQKTIEVENEKPLIKTVNGVEQELSDTDYEQLIIDRANYEYEKQQFGWIEQRQLAYGSIADQLDMMYWDNVNGTTTWKDHIAQVKTEFPKVEDLPE